MTTIGFIRHGVTAWNKEGRAQGSTDIPLDEEGIEMAERVAGRMEQEEWDVIYTSPLIRARRTAEIIAERLPSAEFRIDTRLVEVGGGVTEGTTELERLEKWGAAWRELDLGFEPEDVTFSRGMSFIERVKQVHSGSRVLVVSHGDLIGRLIHALVPNGEFSKDVDNTSVTIIELQESENLCHLYNCTKHLEGEKV